MKKSILILVGAAILAGGAYFGFFMKKKPTPKRPPAMVTLIEVQEKEIIEVKHEIGRVAAKNEVKLEPQVNGYLEKEYFIEGAMVKKGDLLFLIEQEQYLANASKAKADTENAKAALTESEKNLERAKELVEKDYISKSEYDNKLAVRDKYKAAFNASEAYLKRVNYDLKQTKIYAPITGKIGSIKITKGNLVSPSSGALATIVSLDPVYVTYSSSGEDFLQLRLKLLKEGKDINDSKVKLILPGGEEYQYEGVQDFFDNNVSKTTGNVQLRATFKNPDGLLLPGNLVKVDIYGDKPVKKLVIPQAATLEDPAGKYVYILDSENKALMKRIKVGKQYETSWEVIEGLEAGEKIVLIGLQKIRVGAPVIVTPPEGEKLQGKEPAHVQ